METGQNEARTQAPLFLFSSEMGSSQFGAEDREQAQGMGSGFRQYGKRGVPPKDQDATGSIVDRNQLRFFHFQKQGCHFREVPHPGNGPCVPVLFVKKK